MKTKTFYEMCRLLEGLQNNELGRIFTQDEQSILIFRNAEAAFKKIVNCSRFGRLGNRTLSVQEIDMCRKESEHLSYKHSSLAFEIAEEAVLSPEIMKALGQAGYDAKNPTSDTSRMATREVAENFIATNRINYLLAKKFKQLNQIGIPGGISDGDFERRSW